MDLPSLYIGLTLWTVSSCSDIIIMELLYVRLAADFSLEKVDNSVNWIRTESELFSPRHKGKTVWAYNSGNSILFIYL